MIRGVTKISSSILLLTTLFFLNSQPRSGISPSSGILKTVSDWESYIGRL